MGGLLHENPRRLRNFLRRNGVGHIGATVSDDAQLIDETLAGNRAAFGQLVHKYQGRLFNTLLHVVGSPRGG